MSFKSAEERPPGSEDAPERASGEGQPTQPAEDDQPTPATAGDEPVEISDPRALRALAHPGRLTILEHLIIEGPATATECAAVAGLSPSACSYHLRALAKHGFVEEDPAGGADGRQRPWRARMVAIKISSHGGRPEAVRTAGRLLVERVQQRFNEVRAAYLDREDDYPPDWQEAAGSTEDVLHVTPAELEQIQDQIRTMLAGYRRLGGRPRPEGAGRVLVMLDFTPWFPPDSPA
jgi:DNA-binding transcriptional ArsR family regulator